MNQASSPALADLLAALPGPTVRNGAWTLGFCPVHRDGERHGRRAGQSLGVSEKGVIACFAGCERREVLAALGFGDTAPQHAARPTTFKPTRGSATEEHISLWYDYLDHDGDLLFAIGRTPSKQFPVIRPEGGRWRWGQGDVKRVLYRLPELLNADRDLPVLILEGEKDVDRARREGFVATTTPGGAGKSSHCDLSPLNGRHVVIVPDKDEPGARHADELQRRLLPIAASVKRLALPELAAKDLSDYFDAGCTAQELAELIAAASPIPRAFEVGLPAPIDWMEFWNKDHRAEDWLLEPILPRSRSVATFSPGKTGKSELALYCAACLATGKRVLDQPAGEPVDVCYIDDEMTEQDVRERLEDMGFGPESDFSHFAYYLLASIPPLDTLEGGAMMLAIAQRHNAVLVVIDTLGRVLSGGENDADTLRAYYRYTGHTLKAAGVTVWRLDHAGKNVERGQRGTSAKSDDVDLVWQLSRLDAGTRLTATHRRQGWIPQTVDLVRLDDPLRYERAAESWPAGTADLAGQLDALNIPTDWGRTKVRKALKDAGRTAENGVLAAAIRYRNPSRTRARTGVQEPLRTAIADRAENRLADRSTDNNGHTPAVTAELSASLDADSSATEACWRCGRPEADRYDGELRPICPRCASQAAVMA